ncbi:MAG: hypothetical protein Fur005_45800 [Roseiflexaceae bacterium]
MSEASGLSCPQCAQSDQLIRVVDLPADSPVQVARPAQPRIPGSPFGCRNTILVTLIALTASIAIAGLAQLGAPPSSSAIGDLRPGDTAVFTGILAFMVLFVGLFSVLVWREMRNQAMMRLRVTEWHIASERRTKLQYCARCQVVFRPGGRAVAPSQADLLLYEEHEKEP